MMDKKELDSLEKRLREKREIEMNRGELQNTGSVSEKFPKIVLASRSPRRIALIKLLGLNPSVYASEADETARRRTRHSLHSVWPF